jgi:hypothetical protein
MNQIFKEIAKKENGKLRIDKQIVSIGFGARSPYNVYTIKVRYKDINIIITNEIGTTAVGTAKCEFPKKIKFQMFEILTRSHFSALFFGKNNRFKITGNNKSLNSFLEKNIATSKILKLVEDTKFQPYIFSSNENEQFKIITEYHLMFPEWPDVITSIIEFYKNLIDRINNV